MDKDTIQLNRSYTYMHRQASCSWNARKRDDGIWNVHFRADYVPSTDWTATDTADLFKQLEVEHDAWILAVQHRDESLLAKSTKTNG